MKRDMSCCGWVCVVCLVMTGCFSHLEENHRKAEMARKLGEAYMIDGKYSPAYREFTKAGKLYPDDPHLHYDLGNFYIKRQRFDLAVKEFSKALKLKHDYSAARNNLGATYLALKQYDQAIQCLKGLLDNYVYATPHYPNFLLGQAFFHKGDYTQALKYFDEALFLEPTYSVALHWKGKTYLKMGQAQKAIDALVAATKQKQVYAAFYLDLGRAYGRTNRIQDALQAYRKVIAMEPDSDLAKQAATAMAKF